MAGLRVCAIIPTLNEAGRVSDCLTALSRQTAVAEALAVDGGSSDATRQAVISAIPRLRQAGIALRVMDAGKGRAAQMNAGAAASAGDVLLFLHADTLLPTGAAAAAAEAVEMGCVGGAFTHRFIEDDPRLSIISWWANTRSRFARLFFGDQAIFVRRDVFEALGGFRPLPIMEDLDFSSRLRRRGRTALLPLRVRTSGRRFLSEGVGRTCLKMMWLRAAYRAGADPWSLQRHYREVR